MRMLEIYPKLAEVYADRLNLRHEALDIHRRILQLRPSSLDSLEVVIDHQRKDKMWRELGDSLARWVDATAGKDHPARIERMLEIARLHREELGDPGRALGTYAEILDQVPEHAEALAGVRALTEGPRDPTLELRRLRIELGRTHGPRRAELLLECARVQTEQQNDPEGAIATLRELVAEAGAAGPGYEPLSSALKKKKAWAEVVDLMEQRAVALDTAETRAIALEHTMAEAEAHAGVATDERMERLARRLLVERPQDLEARRRLLAVYRGNARHAELAELLRATLGSMPGDDVERRPRASSSSTATSPRRARSWSRGPRWTPPTPRR
jgi:hypothetical protein